MDILYRFNRRIEQLAEGIGDQFWSGILNKIGFAGLCDKRKRQRIQCLESAVSPHPARGLHIQVTTHAFQRRRTPD
ncbi:hypothetical protein SDC9_177721 [bioreactor metagenome]|uniref:Uncharacterized protein n=1 Tax=bioreactor metagenome TaxID=1076179 RepID=A0A645GTV2_9ZZZZ